MVKGARRAVGGRFTTDLTESPKKRLLAITRTQDGDLVLQKKYEDHQVGHHYTVEARTLVESIFGKKPEKFCAITKAGDAVLEVLDFRLSNELYRKPPFKRDGFEWHPVLFDISWLFGFDMKRVQAMAKKGGGLKTRAMLPLDEHPYAEKLRTLLPAR